MPEAIRAVIERNAAKHVELQREDQAVLNASLRDGLSRQGLAFNDVDPAAFRARLSGVYEHWRRKLGAKCWSLLEAATGPLG